MRTAVLLLIYYSCVFYALRNPVFGLLFFIHITIFRPESLVWGNTAFGRLHLITSLSVIVAYLSKKKSDGGGSDDSYQRVNIRLFFVFVLWLVIVSFLAEYSIQLSFDKTIEVAKIFVLCFLFAKLINTKERLESYVWVTSISFGLLSFWGVLQGLAGNPRLDSLWPGGSNYIAAQLTLIAPFCFAKVFDTNLSWRSRPLFLACTLSIVLCSIYTSSRSGSLGLGLGLLAFVLQINQRVKVLAGLAVGIVLISPWIPDTYSHRIGSIFVEEGERDTSAESRGVLWRIALRIWQDHPITGIGLENFSPVKETYVGKVSDIVTSQEMFGLIFNQERRPHGLYTGMMAETGIVGIGLFLTLVFRNILCRSPASFLKGRSDNSLYLQIRAAQAGLIGFTINAFFGDFQYLEMLYLQLFFVGAVQGYARTLLNSETNRDNHMDGMRRAGKKEEEILPLSINKTSASYSLV